MEASAGKKQRANPLLHDPGASHAFALGPAVLFTWVVTLASGIVVLVAMKETRPVRTADSTPDVGP